MEPPRKRQRLENPAHHDFVRGSNKQAYNNYGAQDLDLMEEDSEEMDLGCELEDGWDDNEDPAQELQQRRARLDNKLKSTFESIFDKYEKDFDGIGDEIDLYTGTILVNNGHIMDMEDERDAGDRTASNMLQALAAESDEETSSSVDDGEEDQPDLYDEEEEEEEDADGDNEGSEDEESDNEQADNEDDRGSSSEDSEMDEEDMILRGIQPPITKPGKQRIQSEVPVQGIITPAHRDGSLRNTATSKSQKRSATLPVESDILTQFGPRIGPEIIRYISQQRVIDDENIEPAWRVPSIAKESAPEESSAQATWRTPKIPTATSSQRPILKSVLAQPQMNRTPSPDPGLSIWAPEGTSRKFVGPRKARCTFTAEDDALIVEWLAKARQQGIPLRSERLWQQLELKNSRHTATVWKKRCFRQFKHLTVDQGDGSEQSPINSFQAPVTEPSHSPQSLENHSSLPQTSVPPTPTAESSPFQKHQSMYTVEPAAQPVVLQFENVRPISSYRSASQRPSRVRRPAQRDSTLVNWADATAVIEQTDPELHAGLLEDAEISETYHPPKQESLSPVANQKVLLSSNDPGMASPQAYSRSYPVNELKTPSEEMKVMPNSQSPTNISRIPTSSKPPEIFQRNTIDPSYMFSDDEDSALPLERKKRPFSFLSKPEPESPASASAFHTRPSPILSAKDVVDNTPVSNNEPHGEVRRNPNSSNQGNSTPNNDIDHKNEERSSLSADKKPLSTETPKANGTYAASILPCPRADCQKTYSKPWNLKNHLLEHKRKDRLAAELAKAPKFLEWDDFDELSLGPEDFIEISSKKKPHNQLETPPCIRLKREETVFSGLPSQITPLQNTESRPEFDLDDFDELARDDFELASLPPLTRSTNSQPAKKSKGRRPASAIAEKPKQRDGLGGEPSRPATAKANRQLDFRVPAIQTATMASNTDSPIITRYTKVYAMEVNGITLMRRRKDNWLNATHILKLSGLRNDRLREVQAKEVLPGQHERVQGGGLYQGIWVTFERGLELCRQHGVEELLQPLLAIEKDEPELPDPKVGSKRKFDQIITPSSSISSPPRRTEVQDSAAESGLSSSIIGSSPMNLRRRQRDTAGISPQHTKQSGRARAPSNLMVLVTPMKTETRDTMMHGDLSGQDTIPRASSVVKTPGGTLRRCGLDGFRCERTFCMKCVSPTKLESMD